MVQLGELVDATEIIPVSNGFILRRISPGGAGDVSIFTAIEEVIVDILNHYSPGGETVIVFEKSWGEWKRKYV